MSKPRLSIIIATYNSEHLLPLVLQAIQKQTYPRKNFEVLLVDGGSKDKTLDIGKKYKCRIIKNPRTEPVYAKFLGYKSAKGRYILYLDHDEVLENKDSLKLKIKAFTQEKDIKVVIGSGYNAPQHYPFITRYINEFGDPFSFFIYRLSKDSRFFIPTMRKRYRIEKSKKDYLVFDFLNIKSKPILELAAGASAFDAKFLKEEFPETLQRPELLPHFFYLLNKKYPKFAITQKDTLLHYSSDTLYNYFNKIKWRIKNNIFHVKSMGMSGFSGRDQYQPLLLRYKKIFFLPYSFLIIFSLIDSLYLSFSRKDIRYLLHLPLCLYTASMIVYYYILKLFGLQLKLRSYDEKIEIAE